MNTFSNPAGKNRCTALAAMDDKRSLVGLLAGLVLVLFMLALLPLQAQAAAVARVGSWSSAQTTNLAYTPGAGNDRVILVAVTTEVTNQAATVNSVTYGGQLVTPIGSAVRGAGYSNIAWLGYCNETCIANASGSDIVLSSNANNQYVISAATYENVEQTAPVYDFSTNSSGSATITANLNNALNNQVVYVVSFNQASGTSTPSSGFTNRVNVGAGGNSHTHIVDERNTTSAALPLAISTTFGANSSRSAIVAVSLQEVQCAATAPDDLTATEPQGGTIVLNWTFDSANNDYYTIYRDGSPIGTSTSGSFTDDYQVIAPPLAPNTSYTYTVRGYNNAVGCESANSNAVAETTEVCFSTTGPITIASGQTLSGSTVDLTTLVTDNGATVGNYVVSSLKAPAISELESFSGGDPKGWTYWTTDNVNDPPGNRDLHTGLTTRTDGTGPGTTPNGSFLFFDASTGGTNTRYLTHAGTFNADNNELNVDFKYNMNGANIGTLELQARQNGVSWDPVWTLSGNQGDVWTNVSVNLEALGKDSGTIELRFMFTYGGGFLGDIAIDEVRVHGPGRADVEYFNNTAVAAQTADTTSPSAWPDATELRLDVGGTDNCGTSLNDIGTFMFYVDNDAPNITSFILPGSAVSPISVSTFLVTDNVGVTGYMITESAVAPAADDAGWQSTKPTLITTPSTGSVTFYAWAKDAAGNVSASANQTVTVSADVTAPTVGSFIMADSDFSPIPVNSFSATDDSGVVTGYMITESATAPLPGAGGWQASPPSSVTTAASGSTTFYAWAKDTAGNVSAAATYVVDVKVDTNEPVVTFIIPSTSSSTTISVTTFSAVDNVPDIPSNTGVAGYMIIEDDNTQPAANDPRWVGAPSFTIIASGDGAHTYYAWAKDNAGNVSAEVSDSVTITLPASCDYDIDPSGTYIEAENFTNMGAANPWAWSVVSNPLADASGDFSEGSYLNTTTGGTGTTPNGSRLDYPVNFTSGGTYCIWIRALDAAGAGGGDSTFWGVDGTVVGAITQTADNQWAWANGIQNGTNCTSISTGAHTINLWPREAGQKTDAFVITTTGGTPAYFTGNNDQTTTKSDLSGAGVKMTVDPTCVDSSGGGAPGGGGGSNYIVIPDGQSVNGNPIDVENLYTTDLDPTARQYRALGAESDGFNGFSLESKWAKTDIGGDTTGAPLLINEQLQLTGSGNDIWGNSDSFSYLYQGGTTGSFTIDVKVESIQNTNNSAKGGIMVRQSLATNSPYAGIFITPGNQIRFQRRTASGGTTVSTTASGQAAPRWLRLKRSGNIFYAYYSSNAASWTLVGSATVNMSGNLNIGLAVTSRNNSLDCNGRFDNFMFMPAGVSGMTESWGTTTNASPGTIDTTDWASGQYAVAVKSSSVEPETNTFSYNSCIDSTPSTLSALSGQTVGGSAVSLNALFSSTGNISSFRYQINGLDVLNPWNSFSVVGAGSSAPVTFTVTGTDPDCGGMSYSDSAVITVDNSCDDPDPSTITILTGQSSGGPSVDLTAMATTTGDVASGGLTYKINGVVVGAPSAWDSRSFGTTTPESVNLEVSGVDPDCGTSITAINTIEIDNACTFNPPSISFNQNINYVGAGRAVPYTITVRNEDSFNCGSSTLTVNIDNDTNGVDFDPSYFPDPSTITDGRFSVTPTSATITLAGRESAVIELAVPALAGATEWSINDTQVSVSGDSGSNNQTASTKVFLVSPITHNSVTTGSSKWGGSWGTSETVANAGIDSKYGNFDCLTCHEKGGPNIKWMRGDVTTPDGSNWGTSGLSTLPISFNDAREGGDWGHDDPNNDGSGRTGSTKPCETCHSITMYHRYDTNADPADPPEGAVGPQTIIAGATHFPDRNCIDCHRHSLGFTASCTGCHGNPPLEATIGGPNGLADIPAVTGSTTPGTHYKHVVVLGYDCEYCHDGWRNVGEMPKEVGGQQDINHLFRVFDRQPADADYAAATAGNYTGQDGVSYEGTIIAAGQGTLTCENIYCHGGTDSMGGTNPQWNGNISCNSCHGTSSSNTPPGYSHTTHVGKMGQACTVCHGDGTLNPLPGSNGHVNGSVGWDLTGAPSDDSGNPAKYKGLVSGETGKFAPSELYDGYGTCTNVACHYGTETPPWNSGTPATCTTCHNNGTNDGDLTNAAPNTGNHDEHVDPVAPISVTMVNTFINKCESCHGGGANTGSHPGHIGSSGGVSPVNSSDYVDFGGMTYDSSTATCTSLCHEASTPGIWGSAAKLSCEACHMAPYLGPTVVDPDNEGTGLYSSNGYGSHLKVAKTDTFSSGTDWEAQCLKCHPYHEGGSVTIPEPPTNWDNPGTTGVTETDNMAYKLGLQFPVTGGIHLGGTATSGTTEADICWNCHGTDSEVNEWGYNADTNGANWPETKIAPDTTSPSGHTYWDDSGSRGSYNYGYLYTTNHSSGTYTAGNSTSKWVDSSGWGYYRRDGYQHVSTSHNYRLSRRITSVHSVNFDNTKQESSVATAINGSNQVVAAAQETPDDIRCSYCHDVHDLNKAFADVAAGVNETATGRPYLRGSWMGNPYAPDLPPLSTYEASYASANDNRYSSGGMTLPVSTPRLFSHTNTSKLKGGFFIDANSGRPTEDPDYDSLEETAGICVACHGSDVNNMDFYPNSGNYTTKSGSKSNISMWRSDQVNGHANSALAAEGATHANARNIFDAKRGYGQNNQGMANQAAVGQGNEWGKNPYKDNAPFGSNEPMKKAMKTNDPQIANSGWYGGTPGGDSDGGSRAAEYSIWYYTGSTNPGATVTAAIGTDGSGSGRAHSFTCSKCHSPHATGLPALLITNCLDRSLSNYAVSSANPTIPQATNCHRKDGTTSGWNNLATGQ